MRTSLRNLSIEKNVIQYSVTLHKFEQIKNLLKLNLKKYVTMLYT